MLRDFAIFKAMPKNLMLLLNAGIPGKLNEIKPGEKFERSLSNSILFQAAAGVGFPGLCSGIRKRP